MNRVVYIAHKEGDELTHYGVKGMKWGVRKEYYPSGRGRPSGGKTPSTMRGKHPQAVGNLRSNSISAALAVANVFTLNLAGLAVQGVAAYKFNQGLQAEGKRPRMQESTFVMNKKQKPTTIEQDIKACNPKFNGLTNGYINNCTNVTMTYELRRRGYDVTAKPLFGGRPTDEINKMFGNPEITMMHPSYDRGNKTKPSNQVRASIGDQPKGARGAIRVTFKDGGMGHIFNWEMADGGVRFIDAQDSSRKGERLLNSRSNKLETVEWFRTDNAKLNPKLIGDTAKNRGDK